MTQRLIEMKELATQEAINLKKHASKKEIESLNIENFCPSYIDNCIYGQMTGNCFSQRAEELIIDCCPKVYNSSKYVNDFCVNMGEIPLNGSPYKTKEKDDRATKYYSAIEVAIYPQNLGLEAGYKIISFLKGETETLEL